jgi:kynurenine formamidase
MTLPKTVPILAAVVALAALAPVRSPSAPDLATAKVVDLTHPFDAQTIYWPTSPSAFELKRLASGKTPGGWYYAANAFCSPEHGGTHLDAPRHFSEAGDTSDRIPVSALVRPAVVLDVRERTASNPDYRLTVADLEAWESKHGPVPAGAIALLRTGWSDRWPDRKRYLGDDRPGDASHLHFPSFGEEAVRVLVSQRKVAAIGLDTASIDYGPSADFPVHRIAAAGNVPAFENVTNLGEVPETGAWVVALPMKIAGGSGGPLRIVALVP